MNNSYIDGAMLKKALKGAAKYLDSNKETINSLNVFPVPDGDTGTNMSLTMQSSLKEAIKVEGKNISKVALAASHGSLMGARGNSGVILSQLFRGFALGLEDKETVDIDILSKAFKQGADTAYKAVMKPTEGTILTVARECGEYAIEIANEEENTLVFLSKVIKHGNEILEKTPEMLPVLKEAGVVDAGGKGLMAVLMGAYNILTGLEEELEDSLVDQEQKFQEIIQHKDMDHLDAEDIEFGYCTEFIISGELEDLEIELFRNTLSNQGDSLMVVQSEDIVKVHVHTNNPGIALEEALKMGTLRDIKIDNMRLQYETVEKDKKEMDKTKKKYSFVSISAGEGIGEIFKGMNVDVLVEGGQTMNPSTEDIAKAIDNTNGENIFILPNNSNIILAAEQARDLSDKNVIVIPTRTIPEGISALFDFDESASVSENEEAMLEAISYVQTGQITYSVRDTEINGKKIFKDDIIGLTDGKITNNGKDIRIVSEELLESMIKEDSSLITILYGKDMEEEEAIKLEEKLILKYEDIDIEMIYGGQPIYYYIFAVE